MRPEEIFEEEQRIAEEAVHLGAAILTKPISSLQHPAGVSVARSTTVREAVRQMVENKVGCVMVEEANRLVGVFTERDVLTKVLGKVDPSTTAVESLMTPNPETLSPETKLAYALNKMSVGGFRHIPIVDESGRAVGLVSMRDIVNYIVDLFPNEVLNLPPDPALGISRTREGA